MALVEVALRLAGVQPVRNPQPLGAVVRPATIPELGFQPAPGQELVLEYGGNRPEAERRVSHVFNGQGHRGAEVLRERTPDLAPRIVCVGDSHTFGTGVNQLQSWPARLADVLHASGLPGAQVINLGVPGYDTVQEAIWLQRAGLPLAPDLVLLQYFVNDPAVRGLSRPEEPEPDGLVALVHPRGEGWVSELRRHSRAVDVLLDGLYRHYGMDQHMDQLLRWHADGDPGWLAVQQGLLAARDACAAAGAAFGVVLYPMLLPRGEGYASGPALAKVAAYCAGNGIAVFDGQPALLASGLPPDRLRVAPGDLHAGAEAHAVFAGAVASWLSGPCSPLPLDGWKTSAR